MIVRPVPPAVRSLADSSRVAATRDSASEPRPERVLLLASAAMLLPAGRGNDAGSLAWLAGSIVLIGAALRPPAWLRLGPRAVVLAALALGGGGLTHVASLVTAPPVALPRPSGTVGFYALVAAAAALLLTSATRWTARRSRLSLALAMPVLYLALGTWSILDLPSPRIDVFVYQRHAAQALIRGENPYSLTFPNVYGHIRYYGAGLATPERVLFGFPYTPVSLLLATPGALLGDVRYAHLVAMALGGALVALSCGRRLGVAASGLLLLSPVGFVVLQQSWTEPFVLLLAAGVLFCTARAERLLPWVLGLLLAAKQFLVFALPLIPLLAGDRRDRWSWSRLVGGAVLVAAVTLLPFALADPRALLFSLIEVHVRQPIREDSLSFWTWLVARFGWQLPRWLGLGVASLAAFLASRLADRTPAGFFTALAFTLVGFFAFATQAHANYYFLVYGLLCCAMAASAGEARRPREAAQRGATLG